MNSLKKIIFLLLFCATFSVSSFSDTQDNLDVKIYGNKLISVETILNITGLSNYKKKIQPDDLNLIQKKLFETNFFSKVEIKTINNILEINVVENPIIDYVVINGIDNEKEYKNFIEKKISLKSDTIYSDFLINKDVLLIKEFLSNQGYLNNLVTFQVNKVNNNRVNVFIEIKLNNQFKVKNIFFIGNKKFSSSKLIDQISTTQTSWFKFFSTTDVPSQDRLDSDISSLKNFYLTEGFYDVQISNASIDISDNNYVNLTFSINAGEKFVLNDYVISNNISFLKENQIVVLNSLIKKYMKKVYNYKDVNGLVTELERYFDEINVLAKINYKLIKQKENALLLNFSVEEISQKKIIKNIIVVGNDITEEKVIRNKIIFTEGDMFLQSKIEKSKDNLQYLNIFKNVNFVTNSVENNVDVKISVEEKPTGEISSGLGVSSAGSSITFNLKENNLFGQGIYIDTGLNIGTQQVLGNFTFSNPDFLDTGNTFRNSFNILKNYYKNAGYENKIISNSSSIRYEIFDKIELENGFLLSLDSIDANSGASSVISNQQGDYLTTKFLYNIFNDQRNRKFKPTAGYTVGFGQDLAFPPSDIPTIGNSFFGSFYKSFSEDFTGSIRYKIKSITSLNSDAVKLSDKLFLSDSDLRGFSNRGTGPKVEGDYIGGNYSFSTTISTTIPNGIPEKWNASSNIFIDVANVWGSDLTGVDDSNKVRSSVGIGFTWVSPLGPISMSYAEPITKNSSDNVQNFNFRLGSAF